MGHLKIVTTGYMGSGSSAATDLLTEYEGMKCPNGSFEYVFMHCPNGVFDLEDKLLVGNNALRSDEAIHSFMETMEALYIKDGHWTGNYRERVSRDYMRYCHEFIEELSPFRFDNVIWYHQQDPVNAGMKARLLLMRTIWKLTLGRVQLTRPVSYMDTVFAFPTPEQFYTAARRFLNKIYVDLGIGENSLVLDQLLLPQNLNRLENYLDENTRVIVVDRDPRDVYLLNKLVWLPRNEMIPLPTEEASFCRMYRKIREMGQCDDAHVLRIHFEDLVYRYEETVAGVEAFLGLNAEDHKKKYEYFDPKRSIYNTQLFSQTKYRAESVALIEKELADYLYPFSEELPKAAGPVEVF